LAFDPRDFSDPKYRSNAPSSEGGTGINCAYDQITFAAVKDVLAANASGVQWNGNLSFGPAVPQSLIDHSPNLCIVRGLMMDTLTHEVGRRYFITGKFPSGLTPNGSALPTMVASAQGGLPILPNLAVGIESYNATEPAYASPIRVQNEEDITNILKPLGTPLDPKSDAALLALEEGAATCGELEHDATGLVTLFKSSRVEARSMVNSESAELFAYNAQSLPVDLASALDIGSNADLAGPKGRAAIAAIALENGVSGCVSLELASGLDNHADWDDEHAPILHPSLDALGRLIAYLKTKDIWKQTTLVAFSEFARTPLINSRNGRDHHLASSCLVAGPGIAGNRVIGASSDKDMSAVPVNLADGSTNESGVLLRPADVHATVLQSMGLAYDHLGNQTPNIITAMLAT
jgi:hypothetical protein